MLTRSQSIANHPPSKLTKRQSEMVAMETQPWLCLWYLEKNSLEPAVYTVRKEPNYTVSSISFMSLSAP